MDDSTFSSALFSRLSDDLDLSSLSAKDRFDPSPLLDPLPGDHRVAAKRALLCSVFKKSEVEEDPLAEPTSILRFLEANFACQNWKVDETSGPAVGYVLDYAKAFLASWFEPQCGTELACTMASIEQRARFGPGRSRGLGERPSQYYFKVGDAPLMATSSFIRSWYDLTTSYNPLCEAAEMARKARHGVATLSDFGMFSLVEKSYSAKRVVITEPSLNTFFQLGLGTLMGEVLERTTGLSLSVQPQRNARLARAGSLNGSYATIDLKQCSDYIAMALVDFLFPKSVRQWVSILRTPLVKISGISKIQLWMASTMGNGFTFPLQTALLTAVVLGAYRTLDIPIQFPRGSKDGNFGVFGDDIVCRTEAFTLICKSLHAVGLIVNETKSFSEGPFRESCGHDFFEGVDIRGIYLKRYSSVQDKLSIFNRLAVWSAKHDFRLPTALKFIREELGEDFQFVPPDEAVTAGIYLPFGPPDSWGTWEYDAWEPVPNSLKVEFWDEPPVTNSDKRRFRKWLARLLQFSTDSINEPAVLKALLYGALRNGKLVYRLDASTVYRKVRKVSPRWGWSTGIGSDLSDLQRDRWMRSVISLV